MQKIPSSLHFNVIGQGHSVLSAPCVHHLIKDFLLKKVTSSTKLKSTCTLPKILAYPYLKVTKGESIALLEWNSFENYLFFNSGQDEGPLQIIYNILDYDTSLEMLLRFISSKELGIPNVEVLPEKKNLILEGPCGY